MPDRRPACRGRQRNVREDLLAGRRRPGRQAFQGCRQSEGTVDHGRRPCRRREALRARTADAARNLLPDDRRPVQHDDRRDSDRGRPGRVYRHGRGRRCASSTRSCPMFRVRTMEEALRRSMAQRATYSWLLGIFAGMALVLALGGSYGVTSYLVSQRTREIGIRVALGARSADIVRAVLRRGPRHRWRPASPSASRRRSPSSRSARRSALRGIAERSARFWPAPTALLFALAVAANWLPARRAARVDPMRSLRIN